MAMTPEQRETRKAAKSLREAGSAGPEARAARKAAKVEAGKDRKTGPGVRAARKTAKVGAPVDLSQELHEVIYMVTRVAGAFESLLRTKKPTLSLSQWAMLESIANEKELVRPSQLGRKLTFSRQLVRQSAKKLITLELLEAIPPEEGKKAIGLKITSAGTDVLEDIAANTRALSTTLISEKSDLKVGQANRVLKALSTAISSQLPKKEKAEDDDKSGNASDGSADDVAIELA